MVDTTPPGGRAAPGGEAPPGGRNAPGGEAPPLGRPPRLAIGRQGSRLRRPGSLLPRPAQKQVVKTTVKRDMRDHVRDYFATRPDIKKPAGKDIPEGLPHEVHPMGYRRRSYPKKPKKMPEYAKPTAEEEREHAERMAEFRGRTKAGEAEPEAGEPEETGPLNEAGITEEENTRRKAAYERHEKRTETWLDIDDTLNSLRQNRLGSPAKAEQPALPAPEGNKESQEAWAEIQAERDKEQK